MTHQELQALLHDILVEIADIQVTMKRLANDIHLAMNTSAWGEYSKRYYRADDLLTLKKEEITSLKSRYYAQFPLTVEQCADIGLPSGVTNFYGQDLY